MPHNTNDNGKLTMAYEKSTWINTFGIFKLFKG